MRSQYNFFGTGFPLRLAITISCQLAFILFGYDQGVFSGIVGNSDFLTTFGYPSSGLEGIIVSVYNLGAFTGCVLNFFVCEGLGRRRAMWLAMFFIIVGCSRRIMIDSSARNDPSDHRIFSSAHDNSPLGHRYWNGNRDIHCPYVSERAV